MAEIVKPGVLETPKPRRKLKISDMLIFGITIIIIVVLVVTIVGKLRLKHEVNGAKVVAGKVVQALATQNTAEIIAVGDQSLKAKNTAASLSQHLTATDVDGSKVTFAQLYGKTTPVLDRQIVANNSRGQHVVFIYSYMRLKAPLFVRLDTIMPPKNSHWYLQALTIGTDESALTTVSN